MLSDAVKSQLNIIDYARDIGYTPIRVSSRYYTIKEMDSIRINVEKGLWYRNSLQGQRNDVNERGQIGGSVIDFAAYFDRVGFKPDGVRSKTVGGAALLGLAERYNIVDNGHYRVYNTGNRFNQSNDVKPRPAYTTSFTSKSEISEAKIGIYDVPRDLSGEAVVKDYLTRIRGVSPTIVQRFIDEDMLYQSKPNRNGYSNCVFVSPNNAFVCEHGASERGRFVRTLSGSDMNELFFYTPDKNDSSNKVKTLVVTESVIDMMSVMTQFEREGRDINDYKFLALAGVNNIGTVENPLSLEYHLRKPENANIGKVMLALDNDSAGLKGINNARDILSDVLGYDEQDIITYLPPQGKDWNDYIKLNVPVYVQEQENTQQHTIADVDLVLVFRGDYETITAMQTEFAEMNNEWVGGFADYIHPFSDEQNTVYTCEIFDSESYATELLAIAEKYNVTVSQINHDELHEMYNEENRQEAEEKRISEISNNPMELNENDFHIRDGVLLSYYGKEQNVIIPDGVKEIGAGAFDNNYLITNVTIPDSVTNIGDGAFTYCDNLVSVTIPNGVTEIGTQAFFGCDNLKSVTIPNSVTEIGYGAFSHCTSLEDVTIPDSVNVINERAFRFCTSLKSISIPDGVTMIRDSVFEHCTSLESVSIPDSVTEIGKWAFTQCTSLEYISIPDSVTSIETGAFSGCSNLNNVVIPDSVSKIDFAAFANCTSLNDVVIPKMLDNIAIKLIAFEGTPYDDAEPTPIQEQETVEQSHGESVEQEYEYQADTAIKGYVYICGTDFQGNEQETNFLLNEGITSEDVLNIIEYNTGFYEEVVRGLKAVGTQFEFKDNEGDHPTVRQLEYDKLVDEGRLSFELQVTDMDSGEYSITSYNNEQGGVPYGELALGKNYTISHDTISYERAVADALDLVEGDIITTQSHEYTIVKVKFDALEMVDNVSGKPYSIKSHSRRNEDKEWDEILTKRGYAVIAHKNDRYASEHTPIQEKQEQVTVEPIPVQEVSHGESVEQEQGNAEREVFEYETDNETEKPIEIDDPLVFNNEQETAEVTPEVSHGESVEQDNTQDDIHIIDDNIVITNTSIYSDEELAAMRDSTDTSIEEVNLHDKSVTADDKLKYTLEKGLRDVLDTENFKNWLSTRNTSITTGLSVGNSLRILAQNPSTRYTATYEGWHYFGRQVAKGSQALIISRPIIPNEAEIIKKAKSIYSELQKQIKNGSDSAVVTLFKNSPVSFSMNKQYTMDVSVSGKSIKMLPDYPSLELFIKKRLSECPERYTVSNRFDVRDTIVPDTLWVRKDSGDYTDKDVVRDKDGKPVTRTFKGVTSIQIVNTPERQARFQPSMEGAVLPHDKDKMEKLLSICKELSEINHNVPVFERTIGEDNYLNGAKGYYCRESTADYPNGYIVLDADLSVTDKCSVLLHEIAHSELHREPEKLRTEMGISRLDVAMKEVQAEAVAYSVGKQFGLETDTSSFKYLAAFTSGFDMKQLVTSMDIISKETAKLCGELKTLLDEKGLNLDLSDKNITIDVKGLSTEAMKVATLANDKCTSALQELPKLLGEYSKDSDIVSTLREQYNAYSSQLAMVNNVYDLVEQLNTVTNVQDKEVIANQLSDTLTSISISQTTCQALDARFVEQADLAKGQLRSEFDKDGFSTLKQMSQSYPTLALLSDIQLKYIAESKYISSNFGKLLKTNPSLFVDKVVERAEQLPNVAARNGAFVEIRRCEQHTNTPIFTNGTLCSPAVANKIFATAEDKSAELITKAEEHQETFPTTRCDYTIYISIDGELKSFSTSIEIGSGEQRDLSDNINQFCDQPYKDGLISACQATPLSRSIYIPQASVNVETEHTISEQNISDEGMRVADVVKTFSEKADALKKNNDNDNHVLTNTPSQKINRTDN